MNPALALCWRVVIEVDEEALMRLTRDRRVSTVMVDVFRIDLTRGNTLSAGLTRYEMWRLWSALKAHPERSVLRLRAEHLDEQGRWGAVAPERIDSLLDADADRAQAWEERRAAAARRGAALEAQAWAAMFVDAARAQLAAAEAAKVDADRAVAALGS